MRNTSPRHFAGDLAHGWRSAGIHGAAPAAGRNLEVRLAREPSEVAAFQALRYGIFYEEMSAVADQATLALERDLDPYDRVCDHLLVIDRGRPGDGAVVGGYRLLRGAVARVRGGFYSAGEYDLAALAAYHGETLEIGRSCVHEDYRTGAVIQRLFRGIAAYVERHGIGLIFGCASLPGVDPDALALPLSYLAHFHGAPPDLRPVALAGRYVDMKRIAADAIERRTAFARLPPLVKSYLRAGGLVGDGAVVDRQFGTVDVCMVIEVAKVSDRFRRRYQ